MMYLHQQACPYFAYHPWDRPLSGHSAMPMIYASTFNPLRLENMFQTFSTDYIHVIVCGEIFFKGASTKPPPCRYARRAV